MKYNEDYFERGLQTGISCYENYRWMPELTIPLAHEIIMHNEIGRFESILDFGCAKGYLVKAFRMLNYAAWGTDISEYALGAAPTDVKEHLFHWRDYNAVHAPIRSKYNWIISKDVFEHIELPELRKLLLTLKFVGQNMFVIVPLGKNGKYFAPLNNQDKTHVICEDLLWWVNLFSDVGWKVKQSTPAVENMKQSYKTIQNAHGFFKLKA